MSRLLGAFFCLLPWGSFYFHRLDCWHSSGQYVQVGILVLFCYSFFEKPKHVQCLNRPLGLFMLWAGLVTSYGWVTVFAQTKHYPVKIFFPFFNLLCLVLLYKLIVEYLDKGSIKKILLWLKYSFILFMFYCVLQYLKLDEFYTGLNGSGDQMTGTIANTTHLAGLLAIIQPLFFEKSLLNILSLILLYLLIIATLSATGIVAAVTIGLFWLWFKNKKFFMITLGLSLALFAALFRIHPFFFYNNARFEIFSRAFEIMKNRFITGFGLGSFAISSIKRGAYFWLHAHNEYFQVCFELGLIGLILVLYCVWDYFRNFNEIKKPTTIRLAGIFFGFLIVSLTLSIAHLWIPAVIGIFSYSSIYAIKNTKELEGEF